LSVTTAVVLHLSFWRGRHVRWDKPVTRVNAHIFDDRHILRLWHRVHIWDGRGVDDRPVRDALRGAERHNTALVLWALEAKAWVRDTRPTVTDLSGATADHLTWVIYTDTVHTDLTLFRATKRATTGVLAEPIEAGARRRTADLSAGEDTLSVTTEARSATVYPSARVGLTALRSTALTAWAACEATVHLRATLPCPTHLTSVTGHALTRVNTAVGGAVLALCARVNHTPRDTDPIRAERAVSGATLTAL